MEDGVHSSISQVIWLKIVNAGCEIYWTYGIPFGKNNILFESEIHYNAIMACSESIPARSGKLGTHFYTFYPRRENY